MGKQRPSRNRLKSTTPEQKHKNETLPAGTDCLGVNGGGARDTTNITAIVTNQDLTARKPLGLTITQFDVNKCSQKQFTFVRTLAMSFWFVTQNI